MPAMKDVEWHHSEFQQHSVQWGPQVPIRTFALLEMARCIAIQDHDKPVTQHGLASYVSKFESQSF